jgi:hypothetical protein
MPSPNLTFYGGGDISKLTGPNTITKGLKHILELQRLWFHGHVNLYSLLSL